MGKIRDCICYWLCIWLPLPVNGGWYERIYLSMLPHCGSWAYAYRWANGEPRDEY